MKNFRILLLLCLCFMLSTCANKVKTLILADSQEIESSSVRSDKSEPCNCHDPITYAPGASFPLFDEIKFVQLNFHFPNSSDLKNNFTGEDALYYAQDLIYVTNEKLEKNQKMNLPEENNTPVYDAGYRYKLAKDVSTPSGYAIYEDKDDENWFYVKKGKNKNNYSKTLITKFAKNEDSILNIFAMAYHPDSLEQEDFKSGKAGIALGTSLKIAGIEKYGVKGAWNVASLMNHEVGHIFGLRHSWYKNDGCEDTPPNSNCWSQTKDGPCSGVISNNMMDYNTQQMAITPCQIGIVKKNMHKENTSVRNLLLKDWCAYSPEKSLIIIEDTQIDRSIDMKGDIIVQNESTLRLSCRVHMPKGGKIIVHPGSTLILNGCDIHNDCGETWDGIKLLSLGNKSGIIDYRGKVQIRNLQNDQNES